MFETLSRWLVQKPGHILLIAAGYAALWVLLCTTILRAALRANVFLVPTILCLAYAAWEWLLLRKSPEADVRGGEVTYIADGAPDEDSRALWRLERVMGIEPA
jgi:hypothetical protein